jgi:hypothetical protein
MCAQVSREEFLRNLSDSRLLSSAELSADLAKVPESDVADTDGDVQSLSSRGAFTAFQALRVRDMHFNELAIGNYVILDRLGAGGMGTVFKARHRRMKRVVAIKVLSKEVAKSDPSLLMPGT